MPALDSQPYVNPASFRDPAGNIFEQSGILKRTVTAHGIADFRRLIDSGLYARLCDDKLLVEHDEEPRSSAWPDLAVAVLRPRRIPVVSYPYEWCFGQLKDAALVTLRIQEHAMAHGMSLKDASAFNVQFLGSQPLFIDTLSFEVDNGGAWPAYSQFCRHFLAPLLLMRHLWPNAASLLRVTLDGVPLEVASRALPRSTYLKFGCLVHIHLHARSQQKHVRAAFAGKAPSPGKVAESRAWNPKPPLVASLRAMVEALKPENSPTTWGNYYQETQHYSSEAEAAKRHAVAAAIDRIQPDLVYDLGGNTGAYARLATERGSYCVCFDLDPACVQQNYQHARRDGDPRMLPLVMDLSNPSPGLGFASEERMALTARPVADLLLALALIHHLRISANVPLRRIAEYLSRLGRALAIEWVPKQDPKVVVLLQSRPDTFHDYDERNFALALDEYFEIESVTRLADSQRAIYFCRRRT